MMPRTLRVWAAVIGCVVLTGCSGARVRRDPVPEETDRFAREFIGALRGRDMTRAEQLFSPEFKKRDFRKALSKVSGMLTEGQLTGIKQIGSQVIKTGDKTRTSLTYEFSYEDRWLLVNVVVDGTPGNHQVWGVHVNPLAAPMSQNAFMLTGKSGGHYLFLGFAAVVVAFSLAMLICCVVTKVRRKWLWILFMLVGFGKISINWATGQVGFQKIAVQLPWVAASKMGPYAPWIVSISLPVGALLFLVLRPSLRTPEAAGLPEIPVAELDEE